MTFSVIMEFFTVKHHQQTFVLTKQTNKKKLVLICVGVLSTVSKYVK